jgi:signal transduction histidine kinase
VTRARTQRATIPDQGRPAVVGIGASAGGLEALKAFFGAMPPTTGLVFVVVVHLDPTHESLMPELLSHVTRLSVEQARDRQPLEVDHVYVIPPNRTLTINQGLLRVREVADRRSLRGAIDHFLRSLAEAERDRAVAIVLSGTGTEGTLGARAIKAEEGLVMAQAPETAAQPGMPTSVIATGLVDVVLPPDKMPQALLAYVRAERDLLAAREQAIEDLRRMTRLHELSLQLARTHDLRDPLENVIRAAVEITAAEMGNVQRSDEAGGLSIVAHTGFEQPFLDFFARVDMHTDSACGAATANRQRVLVDNVETSAIFAGSPSLAVLREAGVRAVQSTPLFDRTGRFLGMLSTHYRQVHRFDDAELRWLDLLAQHAADVIERQHTNNLLAQSSQDLETRVAERTRWLSLMHDVARAINHAATWDDALHQVLRRLCETEHWQIGFLYLPQQRDPATIAPVVSCFGEDRFRPFHDRSMQQTYARGDRLPGRVFAENRPFWAADTEALLTALPVRATAARDAGLRAGVALPVAVQGEVVAVLELFSDQAHLPTEQLVALMHGVSDQISRVLERERATARMADLVWREQQELLHTLHDSLGQTLTGLGMLSTGLRQRLATSDSETAATATEIASQSQQALDHVRLLSKSLFPVEVEAESLMAALRDLASATEKLHKIQVRVEGEAPRELRDGKIATELYRIAQEAITNSVKHAQPKTVTIWVEGATGLTRLQIADDGVGIPSPEPTDGSGLRIMRYRAASIGASLAIERGTAGGTAVTCTLREAPISREEPP